MLVVEHVIPRSRGGDDSPENTALACDLCNRRKTNMTLLEWVLTQHGILWRGRRAGGGWRLQVDLRFAMPTDGRVPRCFWRDLPPPPKPPARAKRARAT